MSGMYSPINRAAESITRPKGTGAEYMAELQKKPGYKPAEAQDRDLQALMALPQMARAAFMEKLKAQKNKYPLKQRELTGRQTHHEDYTLPGGENYREILLHTPMPEGGGFLGVPHHFGGTPNILASIRVKDRTTPEGKKMLHLEEIQSDWHQHGREEGYRPATSEDDVRKAYNAQPHNAVPFDELLPADKAYEIQQYEKSQKGVPYGPHAKDWHELALKAMIQHAAENGYDQIAITPGAEQAKRYDLSKHVGRITHMTHHDDPDSGILFAFDPSGHQIIEKHNVPHSQLPEYIGKEGAQKLLGQKPDEHGYRELKGQNLEVGGEGMKGFYDRMVPSFLNKFGKKHGVQVQPGAIDTGENPHEVVMDYSDPKNMYAVRPEGSSNVVSRHFSMHDAYKAAAKLGQSPLHTFDITPAMREDVLKNGIPRYDKGGEVKPTHELFHGTNKEFKSFDKDKSHIVNGVWLTQDKNYANWMARERAKQEKGTAPRVLRVSAYHNNPMYFDILAEGKKVAEQIGEPAPKNAYEAQELLSGGMGWDNVVDNLVHEAKTKKHDSLIIHNFNDNWHSDPNQTTTAHVVFDPNKLKIIDQQKYAEGGVVHKSGGGSMYPTIQEMIRHLQQAGRTPIVPAPNRWFADPVKHPFQQKMIERVLAQTGQGREGFPSGSYINPQTGEPMDFDIMHDLGVAIDPATGRPMMSGVKSDLTSIDPKYGSITRSNLVRKGLFKHEGGDDLLKNIAFLATIEKGGKGHHYGLSTHYASPAELVNTMTGQNPTLRPHSRGDIFGVGDEVGRISIQGKHHPVYEKLLVAPTGSDVQGVKLHKAKGGKVSGETKAEFISKSKVPDVLYRGGIGHPDMSEDFLKGKARPGYSTFASTSPHVAGSYAHPDWDQSWGTQDLVGAIAPMHIKVHTVHEFPVTTNKHGSRQFSKFEFDRRAQQLEPGHALVARQVFDMGPRASVKTDPDKLYSYPSDIYAWNNGTEVKSAFEKAKGGSIKAKVTMPPSMDTMQYELINRKAK